MSKHLRFAVVGALFLVVAATANTGAWVDSESRTTYATFNRPVALPGVELSAGTYIFELASPHSQLNIVRVSSRDRSKIFLTAFTRIVERPAGLPANRMVTLGEARASEPPPVKAWFPAASGNGHEFIYYNR
jgi:hypothetical protein